MNLAALSALLLYPCLLAAEVLVEFEKGDWSVVGGDGNFEARVEKEGVCFRADAKMKLKKAAEILSEIEGRTTYPIRFALSGQEGHGVTLEPSISEEPGPSSLIIVTCAPEGVDVGCIIGAEALDSELKETGRMGVDFEGLESFLQVIAAGVERSKEKGEKPVFVLNVRSESSWGQMVRVMQVIREGGCRSGIVRIDDEFPGLDFVVKMDPMVVPPVHDSVDLEKRERIVVNLSAEEGVTDAGGDELADDESLRRYIERERTRIEGLGKEPVILLRGEKQTVFARCRNVIRVAAKAGVDEVIFGTYGGAKESSEVAEEGETSSKAGKEKIVDMTLPKSVQEDAPSRKIFLHVDEGGGIRVDGDPQRLDADMAVRELTQLSAALRGIQKNSEEGRSDLAICIFVAPKCAQQRVIDVLNTLAGLGISKVTFTDEKPSEEK
jgi:biopolymer transport protein ExbD